MCGPRAGAVSSASQFTSYRSPHTPTLSRYSADDVNWAAGKLTALRLWPSADGSKPWDRSVTDIGGGIL